MAQTSAMRLALMAATCMEQQLLIFRWSIAQIKELSHYQPHQRPSRPSARLPAFQQGAPSVSATEFIDELGIVT